jgi:hypothetical protein
VVGFVLRRCFARAALFQAAAILLIYSSPHLARADIIYNLIDYPADQNGWSISGTITTDGMTGYLTSNDILAWTWTATDGTSTISRSSPGSLFEVVGLLATPQSLSIPDEDDKLKIGNNDSGGNVFLLWQNVDGSHDVIYQGQMGPEAGFGWFTRPSNAIWQNDYQIANLTPGSSSAVPEPSSIIIWSGLASLGILIAGSSRRSPCSIE